MCLKWNNNAHFRTFSYITVCPEKSRKQLESTSSAGELRSTTNAFGSFSVSVPCFTGWNVTLRTRQFISAHTDFALFSKRKGTSVSFMKRLKVQFVLSCLLCDNVVLTCSPQQCLYSWYLCCLSGAGWGPFLHWEPVWFSSGAWMDPLFTANNCSRQVAKAFQQGQHASLNLGRGLSP